jgi:tetratricopeptide (TPR) repeat protein
LFDPHRDPVDLEPPAAGVTPEEFADRESATTWLATEHDALVAAVPAALGAGLHRHAWRLAFTITPFLSRRGHWGDVETVTAVAIDAAAGASDLAMQARGRRLLGTARTRLGRYEAAREQYELALRLYTELGDELGSAHAHYDLSWLDELSGQSRDAVDQARRALLKYRAGGHTRGEGEALTALGWYQGLLGEYSEAFGNCRRALALQRRIGDRYGEAFSWYNLGHFNAQTGRHRDALSCLRQALLLFREVGDRYEEAGTLRRLGDVHAEVSDGDSARTVRRQALAILEDLDHPDAEGVRRSLGGRADHGAS